MAREWVVDTAHSAGDVSQDLDGWRQARARQLTEVWHAKAAHGATKPDIPLRNHVRRGGVVVANGLNHADDAGAVGRFTGLSKADGGLLRNGLGVKKLGVHRVSACGVVDGEGKLGPGSAPRRHTTADSRVSGVLDRVHQIKVVRGDLDTNHLFGNGTTILDETIDAVLALGLLNGGGGGVFGLLLRGLLDTPEKIAGMDDSRA